jgi:ABC-type Mn2+/Zn2+ transport system permease subunit
MDRSIKSGVFGFVLSVIINLLSPVYLYFVPSFLVAILVVYIYRLETVKEGLVAAFMTYVFSDGILGTITLATYYFTNEPYPSFNIDVWTMFSPVVSAVTAVIAGYIGVWLVQKRKPAQNLPLSPTSQLPPV